MDLFVLLGPTAPAAAAALSALLGWHRISALGTASAAAAIGVSGVVLAARSGADPTYALGGLLRADSLSAIMLIVIGAVGTLASVAGITYLDGEIATGHISPQRGRLYATLVPAFLAAMALAVLAANIGIMWAAIEATTVITAFLVGHRGHRLALEAAWKYVVICSVGIAIALLGTVLLYFAAEHAGASPGQALNLDTLLAYAAKLDPSVTRLAAGLLLIGYGAKAGLVPFHTWLADAHSQAPAPVSALMSGVLLAVGFSALLRLAPVLEPAAGAGYLRTGLLVVGMLTVAVAALLLTVQTDFKRMLAYSSMENMGLIAIAAAVGTRLAIAALLLHVLAHGLGKSVLFLAAGTLQESHHSTSISAVRAVLARSRLVATSFAVGVAVVVALPPFAMFASEITIARSLADARLGWVLAVVGVFVVIAFAAIVQRTIGMLLGAPDADAPAIAVPRPVGIALIAGVTACLLLGITAGPLAGFINQAATLVGGA
ncbi:MAG: proton-conducting transporter membrane subunit [Nakamurella sp.]